MADEKTRAERLDAACSRMDGLTSRMDAWSEGDHPRATDGKFGQGGGSSSASITRENAERDANKAGDKAYDAAMRRGYGKDVATDHRNVAINKAMKKSRADSARADATPSSEQEYREALAKELGRMVTVKEASRFFNTRYTIKAAAYELRSGRKDSAPLSRRDRIAATLERYDQTMKRMDGMGSGARADASTMTRKRYERMVIDGEYIELSKPNNLGIARVKRPGGHEFEVVVKREDGTGSGARTDGALYPHLFGVEYESKKGRGKQVEWYSTEDEQKFALSEMRRQGREVRPVSK